MRMADFEVAGRAIVHAQTQDVGAIPYKPTYTKITGRVTAAILFQQVLYWWAKSGSRPFYKFRKACTHRRYTPGDSWVEELGFTPAEFDGALQVIGTKITTGVSKNEVAASNTCAALVLYWTDSSRVTWYMVNERLAYAAVGLAYNLQCPDNAGFWDYLQSNISGITFDTENTQRIAPAHGTRAEALPQPPTEEVHEIVIPQEEPAKPRARRKATVEPGDPAPSPARRKAPPDPRKDTPAIQAAHEVAGRYPPKELWDEIITLLGEEPRRPLMEECRYNWVERGYNPAGWAWLMEWYRNGRVPPRPGAGHGTRSAQPDPGPVDWMAVKQQLGPKEDG